MEIILNILSILGITLLVLVGLVLLIILIVLAAPIKYKLFASADGSNIKADAVVKWLLFIKAPVSYGENGFEYSVRLFGKQVFPKRVKIADGKDAPVRTDKNMTDNNAEPENKPYAQSKENTANSRETVVPRAVKDSYSSINNTSELTEVISPQETTEKINVNSADDKAADKTDSEMLEENTPVKESIWEKLDKLVEKITSVFEICEKEKSEIEVFFKRKSTKYTLEILKKDIIKLLNHIRPRKFTGDIEFGFDDPATTGYTLAAISAFYGLYCENLEITPDFSQKVLKGNVKLSGHICLGYIVYIALDVYLRKRVRLFVKNILALKDVSIENFETIKAQLASCDATDS